MILRDPNMIATDSPCTSEIGEAKVTPSAPISGM